MLYLNFYEQRNAQNPIEYSYLIPKDPLYIYSMDLLTILMIKQEMLFLNNDLLIHDRNNKSMSQILTLFKLFC